LLNKQDEILSQTQEIMARLPQSQALSDPACHQFIFRVIKIAVKSRVLLGDKDMYLLKKRFA